jgi:hypothetical protein
MSSGGRLRRLEGQAVAFKASVPYRGRRRRLESPAVVLRAMALFCGGGCRLQGGTIFLKAKSRRSRWGCRLEGGVVISRPRPSSGGRRRRFRGGNAVWRATMSFPRRGYHLEGGVMLASCWRCQCTTQIKKDSPAPLPQLFKPSFLPLLPIVLSVGTLGMCRRCGVQKRVKCGLRAKDTGAIELMGGVSKTSRRDFVPGPDINYFKL